MSLPEGQLTTPIGSPIIIHPILGGPGDPPPPLSIAAVSPLMAAAGQPVTLAGHGFGSQQGSGYVLFTDQGLSWGEPGGEAPFEVKSWSDAEITFAVPEPGGPGNRWAVTPNSTATITVVSSAGARSNIVSLQMTAVPQIASLSSADAAQGTTIIITGQYFGAFQESGYVAFADDGVTWGQPGSEATLQVVGWSDTQISFLIPQKDAAGQQVTPGTTATITVTNGAGLTSNGIGLKLVTDVHWPITINTGVTDIGNTHDGHLQTFVTITQSGAMTAVTHTWDTNGWGFLTGFHGACTVSILDWNNNVVDAFGSQPFGVEGGQTRTDTWTAQLTPNDLEVISSVAVVNFYDPQYSGPAAVWAWVVANENTIESAATFVASL
jgi:hypothetical protein